MANSGPAGTCHRQKDEMLKIAWIKLAFAVLGVTGLGAEAASAGAVSSVTASRNSHVDRVEVLESARVLARKQLDLLAAMDPQPLPLPAPGIDPVPLQFFNAERAENPTSWHQATFWIGLAALADSTGDAWPREAVIAHGQGVAWRLGKRLYNADDHLIGSAWLWAAKHGGGVQALKPLQSRFDQILAAPPRVHLALILGPEGIRSMPRVECLKRWCWADAIFMAPATWLELARTTGDLRYRDYAIDEFRTTSAFLYDPADRLYFRDSRFFAERDGEGRKVFWSRGNGWAIAGVARMLDALPRRDHERGRIAAHFREFAGRLADLQRSDGYWSSSLLDKSATDPETSGTALITFALAKGIHQGILPRSEFEPVVLRGWSALRRALQPDGRLGWVQPAGDRPGPANAQSAQVYASGAFLLAAAAISDLAVDNRNRCELGERASDPSC